MTNQESIAVELGGLLKILISEMIDSPNQLVISRRSQSAEVEYTATVNKSDIKGLIGRGAQNHKALGAILRIASERHGFMATLGWFKENNRDPMRSGKPALNRVELIQWIDLTAEACFGGRFFQIIEPVVMDGIKVVVVADRDQDPYKVMLLSDAFYKIFRAIGNKYGQRVEVEMTLAGKEKQPKTAAGRHNGEIKRGKGSYDG